MPPPRKLPPCTPASLTPLQQAELYDSLAAEARRRADLSTAQDAAEPYITLAQAEAANLAPLASPHGDAPEEPDRPAHERPWYRLHDEEGAKAIEAALAEIEAAKLGAEPVEGAARLLEAPHPYPSSEKEEPAAQRSEDEGDSEVDNEDRPPATTAPLSPRTGKPLRPYKKRTPKPPFTPPGLPPKRKS